MATVAALSSDEWVQAAREYLGVPAEESVTLVAVRPARGGGDDEEEIQGFVGDGLAVSVDIQRANGDLQLAALYLKAVPVGDPVRAQLALETRAFVKESGLYAQLFPLMRRAAPAADADRPWAPRCFIARPTLLVFEDLRGRGFAGLGNAATLNEVECSVALDTLARFHAAAIALDERLRAGGDAASLRERFPQLLQENMLTASGTGGGLFMFMQRSYDAVAHIASMLPAARDSPFASAVRRRTPELLSKTTLRLAEPSSRYRNVMCHGDMWISNMMMRRQPNTEVVLVDFQTVRWAPPAHDVEMLLHTCTRRALRDACGLRLRRGYHAALTRELRAALGATHSQVERLLPWEEFAASSKEQLPLGRILAAAYHCNDLLPKEILRAGLRPSDADGADTLLTRDRIPSVDAAFQSDPHYKERLTEDVQEILEEDILPALAADAAHMPDDAA